MRVDAHTIIIVLLVVLVLLGLYSLKGTQEGFLVHDNYNFEDFNYWFRTPPLLYPGGPLVRMPLPVNERLF